MVGTTQPSHRSFAARPIPSATPKLSRPRARAKTWRIWAQASATTLELAQLYR